ncbi:MAG: CBS domain-containing protein [Acidimicrobiales bacterium]
MTNDLIALQPGDQVGRARDLLLSFGIHALPVMDGDDVVGIITSADLVDNWPEDTPVTDIMTPVPMFIDVAASIAEAAEVMVDRRIHHLLVSDETEIVGILSTFDLIATLAA